MKYKYIRMKDHYRVLDENDKLVCYVKRKWTRSWFAWTDQNTKGRSADKRADAVALLVQTPAEPAPRK